MNNVRDIEEWWWQPVWRSKTTKSCGGMLSILYRFPLKLHSKQPCKGLLNYYYRSIEWIKNNPLVSFIHVAVNFISRYYSPGK